MENRHETQEWRDVFTEAFCSEIMARVPDFDINADGLSATPWAAPWTWTEPGEYAIVDDAEKCGRYWASHNAEEIGELTAEERRQSAALFDAVMHAYRRRREE